MVKKSGNTPSLARAVALASALLLFTTACGLGGEAEAEYPTEPITLVVAFEPGGSNDRHGRIFAEFLAEHLGQPVSVENRPGGSGVTGALSVHQAEADGYTMLTMGNAILNITAIQEDTPYSYEDFTPLGLVSTNPLVLTVSSESPYETVDDLAEAIRANPGELSFGTAGLASGSVYGIGQFLSSIEVEGTEVRRAAFDGGAPVLAAIAGQQVNFGMQNVPEALALIEAGELRPLMVGGDERSPQLPDVPHAVEAGYSEVTTPGWVGFVGPPGLPDHVADAWVSALEAAAADETVAEAVRALGAAPTFGGPDEFAEFLDEEFDTATRVAEDLNLADD